MKIAPGVYDSIQDYSAYVPGTSTTGCAMVGSASKGPLDVPTLISSEGQLVSTFGPPSTTHIALFSAIQYLRAGKQLYFVRVATYSSGEDGYAVGSILNGTGATVCSIQAATPGTWGNSIKIEVIGDTDGNNTIVVHYYNSLKSAYEEVERFSNLYFGTNNSTHVNYAPTRINGISEYIVVSCSEATAGTTADSSATALAGGDDGATANTPVDADDIIGSAVGNTYTGLQSLRNPDQYNISMVAAPGRSEAAVVTALITICATRRDCIALIDPPSGLTAQQVVDWHNGEYGSMDGQSPISSYYGVIAGNQWIYVYDGYSSTDTTDATVLTPPSGAMAYLLAAGDRDYEVWYAHAGPKRGIIPFAVALEYAPEEGDRILFRDNGNCVNAIVQSSKFGIMLNDFLTCQRSSSALRELNVTRMLLSVMKNITSAIQYLLWEPNDAITWESLKNLCNPELAAVKARRGLEDYKVVCDETTNPTNQVAQGVMRANILLKPTHAASVIEVDFLVLPSGASFDILG